MNTSMDANIAHSPQVWQENLGYEMRIHMDGGPCKSSTIVLAGVPGRAPPIYVEFVNPMMPNIASVLPTGLTVRTTSCRSSLI